MASSLEQITYVTNIPFITNDTEELKDKLEVYFGQQKHGEGEVEQIICPVAGKESQAFVVFESAEGKCDAHYQSIMSYFCFFIFVFVCFFFLLLFVSPA